MEVLLMGMFSRIADIINSNISALLDKAEDPKKIARLMIREMEDTLVEVRTSIARYLVEQKQLNRHIHDVGALVEEWREKAELAIRKEREDLAREAILVKKRWQDRLENLSLEAKRVQASLDQANSDMSRLQKKLDEAKSKYQSLCLRYHSANDRVKLNKMSANTKINDAFLRYEKIEKRIDHLEAEADSYTLTHKTLDDQFNTIEKNEEVEEEIKLIRKKIEKGQKQKS